MGFFASQVISINLSCFILFSILYYINNLPIDHYYSLIFFFQAPVILCFTIWTSCHFNQYNLNH